MKKFTLFIVLCSVFAVTVGLAVPSAHAVEKNRLYFLRDDGEFSEEEKDEEAQYIYGLCTTNYMLGTFFDCACVAGAFRMERDVSDDIQDSILNRIYNETKSPCINSSGIAGSVYKECQKSYSKNSGLIRKGIDPDEMCQCYANEVALTYEIKPVFRKDYISSIKTKSYIYCTSGGINTKKISSPSQNLELKENSKNPKEIEDAEQKKTQLIEEIKNIEEEARKSNSSLPDFVE